MGRHMSDTAWECSRCGLLNPPSSRRCDCGHPFGVSVPRATPLTGLFSFTGRIARAHYWALQVGVLTVELIGYAVARPLSNLSESSSLLPIMVVLPLYLVCLWIGIGASVRRCHDRGRPGWMLALPVGFMAFVVGIKVFENVVSGPSFGKDTPGYLVVGALLAVITGLWTVIELGFLPGSSGRNQYGEPPYPFAMRQTSLGG